MSSFSHHNHLNKIIGEVFRQEAAKFLIAHIKDIFPNHTSPLQYLYVTTISPHWSGAESSKVNGFKYAFNAYVSFNYMFQGDCYGIVSATRDLLFEGISFVGKNRPSTVTKVDWAGHGTSLNLQHPLDDQLVPDTSDGNFEKWAAYILEQYTGGKHVSAEELAAAMKLTIVDGFYLSENGDVKARIVLHDTYVDVWNEFDECYRPVLISQGTILLDNSLSREHHRARNSQIYHECVHWALHRQCMALLNTIKRTDSYACGEQSTDNTISKVFSLLEYQAKAIASCLQFPFSVLRNEILNFQLQGKSLYEMMEPLRQKFDTSMLALKIRMKELGCSVDGYYSWTNNHYAPRLDIPSCQLQKGEFYQISYKVAFEVYKNDSTFKDLIKTGLYCYVDDVFVLADQRFIGYDEVGSPHLTDTAKKNLDCCCIKFKATTREGKAVFYYQEALDFLNSTNNGDGIEIQVANDQDEKLKKEQAEVKIRSYAERERLKKLIEHKDFSASLEAICEDRGMSRAEVSRAIGKGKDIYKKVLDGRGVKDVSMDTLVRICVAFRLPPLISRMIFDKCPHIHYPDEKNQEESVFLYILDTLWCSDNEAVRNAIASSSKEYEPTEW